MGLLDSLFNSDSYGGQGGLLDFLRNTQMQQANYQPSDGFPAPPASFADRFNALPNAPQPFAPPGGQFDNASFDPSTYAPNQAQPIAVGDNYQMPRIGSADQFSPSPAAIPQNAQPAQGTIPQQQPSTDISAQSNQSPQVAPSFLTPPSSGGFKEAMRGAMLNMAGGPIGMLMGGVAGASGMLDPNPRDVINQNLSAQYKAFVDAGMPRNVAMAAVLNPKVLEQVGPGYFGKNEIVEGGTDPLTGKKTFVLKNTVDGTVTELNSHGGATGTDSGPLFDRISAMRSQGATREQMLSQIPAGYREDVASLLSGKAVPANMGRAGPRAALITLAKTVDPTFDETLIPMRVNTAKDYAPNGQSGRSIVALNTVQHHIGKLSDDLENVGDTGWTLLNSIRNGLAVNTPIDPKQGKAVQAIQDDIKAVSDEMSTAYKAGRVSDHEIEAWNRLANSNLPLRQLKQGIYDFVGLLNGKRDQLNETHQSIIGRDAPGINKELNSAITQKVTQRNSDGSSTANNSKPPTVIQNGHTYTLQADGSYK